MHHVCEKCEKRFHTEDTFVWYRHGVIARFMQTPLGNLVEFKYNPADDEGFYHKGCFTDDPPQVGSILDKIKELVNTLNDKEANEIYKYLYYGPHRCRL